MTADELGSQPVYPIRLGAIDPYSGQYESYWPSMSKLEAFTMAALTGLCANPQLDVSSDKIGVVAVTAAKLTLKALVEGPHDLHR